MGRKSKGKKRDEQRDTTTRRRNHESDRWYPHRTWSCAWCVSYARGWWNGSTCFRLPSSTCTDRNRPSWHSKAIVARRRTCPSVWWIPTRSYRPSFLSFPFPFPFPFPYLSFPANERGSRVIVSECTESDGAFLGTHRNQSTTDATNEGTKGQWK